MLKEISNAAGQVKYTLVGKREKIRAENRALNPYFNNLELRAEMKPKISMRKTLVSYNKIVTTTKIAEASISLNNARISFINTLGKSFPFLAEFLTPFAAGLGSAARSPERTSIASPNIAEILSEAFKLQQSSIQSNSKNSFGK